MADYDIGAAFSEIEDELISSMIRNLKRHQVEELTEGFEWTQWQALQIQALEDYKRKAAQKFGAKFSSINDKIDDMLTKTYNDSATVQEQQILRAIKKGLPQTMTANVGTGVIQGEFFKTNDRKLDALIKATKNDMQKAEYAVLRMTDDKYRKIIFNAQVYANTGAGTYAKAVDMATKDFLAAGINCIQYKNGRRVNIVSYAEMAIRTANKRAYLQGEGEMRKKWGIHTVILNQRVNACPKCSRFVGKVIVDDVWSGGTAKEAEKSGYLLMSDCIKQGLYHPNCQDSHTTYFRDILSDEDEEETNEQSEEEQASSDDNAQSTITETSQNEHIEQLESNGQITPQRQRINEQLYDAEQQQNYCEYQANKYDRLSKYSLDEDNQRWYSARKREWKERLSEVKESIQNFKKSVAKSTESSIIDLRRFSSQADPMYEVTGSAFESNPKEVQQMIDTLKEWGVEVSYGSSTLGYGCTRRGYPGGMSVTKNASYSAWCHEFQHVKDDREAGWNGVEVLWFIPEERERRERRAYAIEIQLAREAGREDIAKRLEENLNDEIRKIYNETEVFNP